MGIWLISTHPAMFDVDTQIIDIMLPGDFALVGAVHAPVAACSIDALSDARYINIRPADANGPEVELADLRQLMAAEIVRTQSRTSELLLRLGKNSSASRIAYALLEFFMGRHRLRLSFYHWCRHFSLIWRMLLSFAFLLACNVASLPLPPRKT